MDALKEMDRGKLRFIIRTPIVILFLLQFSNFSGSLTVQRLQWEADTEMNITEWERFAKWFKLQMSVLTPSMEIAQPMPGSLTLFPDFNKNVTVKG